MAENTNPSTETLAVTVIEEKSIVSTPNPNKEEDQNPTEMTETKADKMKRILLPLRVLCFLLSLPILAMVIWLLYVRECDCEDILQLPKLQLGIVIGLIILFFANNAAVYLKSRFPMPGLILVMVPLIVMMTVGLALVGAYKMESRMIPGSPMWLKMKVNSNSNWNNIKSCIYDTGICKDLIVQSYMVKSYDFEISKLSPEESGCCKPPSSCDMEYVNATYWRKGKEVGDVWEDPYDIDCDLWQNDETLLCYNCHACKEGFITTLRGKWLKLGIFIIIMTILLIIFHLLIFVATMFECYAG